MNSSTKILSASVLAILLLFGCDQRKTPTSAPQLETSSTETEFSELEKSSSASPRHVVIANRAGGSISVIDLNTDQVVGTHALPTASKTPEPMYVVWARNAGRVFVGDRANNRVVVFRDHDFSLETTVPAGAGIWHMWADEREQQLWVANDIDKTCTVINPTTLQVLATVPLPTDLVALGGKPHDVMVSRYGKQAYVSLIGVQGASDYVVLYSTNSFEEKGRAAVGKDPHLSTPFQRELLYVPCQNSNAVIALDRFTMQQVASINVPGAHGANMMRSEKVFYTTNLPGGGINGVFAIDPATHRVLGSVNTPFPTPHNLAVTPNGRKLYVTHSGATANQVTVYSVSGKNPVPVYLKSITAGLNPFGLALTR